MPRKTILLVDDDAIILLALRQELRLRFGEAYAYETATSGAKGLERAAAIGAGGDELAIVISDWLMPGMKGDEFLAEVKRRHPEVRCIIVSGQADPEAIAKARELVALDAFIRKPWNRRELLRAVDSCVDS